MLNRLRSYFVILLFASACLAQVGRDPGPAGGATPDGGQLGRVMDGQPSGPRGNKSPSGKMLESEHALNVKDAQALAKLSEELRDSLEQSSSYALSVVDLKKADDVERLIEKLHNRLKHDYGASGQAGQNVVQDPASGSGSKSLSRKMICL